MSELEALLDLVRSPTLGSEIDARARAHEIALAADPRAAVRRAMLRDGFDCTWMGEHLRSLWLVSHRALRRAGFRRHPDSFALLLAWRGAGLVLVRPGSERRSIALAPIDAVQATPARFAAVPADVPYDTLADSMPWHVLAFHSHRAAGLVRLAATQEGWIEVPEEALQ
jgi:hypothetical protein